MNNKPKFIKTMSYALGNNLSVALYQLLSPVLMISLWGIEGYGDYIWNVGVAQIILIAEFGLLSIVGNYIAISKRARIAAVVNKLAIIYTLILSSTVALIAVILHAQLNIQYSLFLAIVVTIPLFGINYCASFLRGVGHLDTFLVHQVLFRVAELITFFIVAQLGFLSVEGALICMGIVRSFNLFLLILRVQYHGKLRNEISSKKIKHKKALILSVVKNSFYYSLFTVINISKVNFPVAIFGAFLGKDFVGAYAITRTLSNIIQQASQSVNQVVWQFASASKDYDLNLKLNARLINSVVFVLMSILVFIFSKDIVIIWIGEDVKIDELTTSVLLAVAFLYSQWSYMVTILVAKNEHANFSISASVILLLSILLLYITAYMKMSTLGLLTLLACELAFCFAAYYFYEKSRNVFKLV